MADGAYVIVEFNDGLQLIPDNWFNDDCTKVYWPNFTNNQRYDKAVLLMEDPVSTWTQHPVRKIIGKFSV